MGGKSHTRFYEECLCCKAKVRSSHISSTPDIPLLTLRRIGLCQECLEGDCFCENVDDLCDQLGTLEVEYDDEVKGLKNRIDELEAAGKRAALYNKARSS